MQLGTVNVVLFGGSPVVMRDLMVVRTAAVFSRKQTNGRQ